MFSDGSIKYYYWHMEQLLKKVHEGTVPIGALLLNNNLEYIRVNKGKKHCEQRFPKNSYKNATLFVTLEPCIECTTFLHKHQISTLVFSAYNCQYGGCGGALHLNRYLQTKIKIIGGIYHERSSKILKKFFQNLRIDKTGATK